MLLSEFIRKKKKLAQFKKEHVEDMQNRGIELKPREITDDYIDKEIRDLSGAFLFKETEEEEMWTLLDFEFKNIKENE